MKAIEPEHFSCNVMFLPGREMAASILSHQSFSARGWLMKKLKNMISEAKMVHFHGIERISIAKAYTLRAVRHYWREGGVVRLVAWHSGERRKK